MPKIVNPCSDHENTIFYEHAKSRETPFSVIPAKVPRQARDPELAERAGIQVPQELLDPGDPVPAKAGSRGDGLGASYKTFKILR